MEANNGEQLEVSRAELLACVEHYKGVPVTQDALTEYCNLNHIGVISVGVYSDILYQYNHDKRMDSLVPKIMQILTAYKSIPELLDQADRKKLSDANEQLSVDICKLMEDEGILYEEIDLVTANLGSYLKAILDDAGKRANNMASTMLFHTATEKFGKPMTLKSLGEAFRGVASAKGAEEGVK